MTRTEASCLRVLHFLAVHGGGQVDGHVVALAGGAVHRLQGGEPLAQPAQVLLDLVRRHRHVLDGHRQSIDGWHLELGAHVHFGGEGELLAVVELGDLQLRLAEREDVLLGERLAVQLRNRVVDRLLEHRPAAEPLVDDPRRDVPRPEPRHPDLPGHLAICLVEAWPQLVEGNLDNELHPGRAQLLDVGLH